MPRKARSVKRHDPTPDPKYGNSRYGKFINYLMERGKKSVARKIFYDTMDEIKRKMEAAGVTDIQPNLVFEQALKNIGPLMEIKGRRVGGANYQVPIEVQEPRKTVLAMRWLLIASRARKGAPMHQRLASEVVDAFNKTGAAMKKREDTHRMAEANKAFAHFGRSRR